MQMADNDGSVAPVSVESAGLALKSVDEKGDTAKNMDTDAPTRSAGDAGDVADSLTEEKRAAGVKNASGLLEDSQGIGSPPTEVSEQMANVASVNVTSPHHEEKLGADTGSVAQDRTTLETHSNSTCASVGAMGSPEPAPNQNAQAAAEKPTTSSESLIDSSGSSADPRPPAHPLPVSVGDRTSTEPSITTENTSLAAQPISTPSAAASTARADVPKPGQELRPKGAPAAGLTLRDLDAQYRKAQILLTDAEKCGDLSALRQQQTFWSPQLDDVVEVIERHPKAERPRAVFSMRNFIATFVRLQYIRLCAKQEELPSFGFDLRTVVPLEHDPEGVRIRLLLEQWQQLSGRAGKGKDNGTSRNTAAALDHAAVQREILVPLAQELEVVLEISARQQGAAGRESDVAGKGSGAESMPPAPDREVQSFCSPLDASTVVIYLVTGYSNSHRLFAVVSSNQIKPDAYPFRPLHPDDTTWQACSIPIAAKEVLQVKISNEGGISLYGALQFNNQRRSAFLDLRDVYKPRMWEVKHTSPRSFSFEALWMHLLDIVFRETERESNRLSELLPAMSLHLRNLQLDGQQCHQFVDDLKRVRAFSDVMESYNTPLLLNAATVLLITCAGPPRAFLELSQYAAAVTAEKRQPGVAVCPLSGLSQLLVSGNKQLEKLLLSLQPQQLGPLRDLLRDSMALCADAGDSSTFVLQLPLWARICPG